MAKLSTSTYLKSIRYFQTCGDKFLCCFFKHKMKLNKFDAVWVTLLNEVTLLQVLNEFCDSYTVWNTFNTIIDLKHSMYFKFIYHTRIISWLSF